MRTFLARSVMAAKWKERDIGGHMSVPADGITNDIRVKDDCLSFWTCDPNDPPSVEQVVLALAAARDTVDKLDLVWIDETAIKNIPLRIVPTEGRTPAQLLRDRHRDVADIDLGAMYKLAQDVAKAVNVKPLQVQRWTKAEVMKILKNAAVQNSLDMNAVGEKIRIEIERT
jgi:hypothetical protein